MARQEGEKLSRILHLLMLLQRKKPWLVEELTDRLQVSRRTFFRDLNTLSSAGVPIVNEYRQGYTLMPGFTLPPIMFSNEEAIALMLGGKFAEKYADDTLQKAAQTANAKIEAALPKEKKELLGTLTDRVDVQLGKSNAVSGYNNDVLLIIQHALSSLKSLHISYRSSEQDTQRQIDPYGLLFYGDRWHVIAYCHLRENIRDFRLDRIVSCSALTHSYNMPVDFSLKDYLQRQRTLENPVVVSAWFANEALDYAVRKQYYGLVDEVYADGGAIMTFIVPSTDFLLRWFMSFGDKVRVLSPELLQKRIVALADEVIAIYKT